MLINYIGLKPRCRANNFYFWHMEEKFTSKNEIARARTKKMPAALAFSEHGKIPPQAIDLEEAVLGALMLEKDALTSVIELLKPEVFYKDAHQMIFKAIQNLFAKIQPIDILTVTNELKLMGELEAVGGPFYVTQLTNRIASAANIEFHTRILLQKFIQRELIRVSTETIRDSFEDTSDVFDLLDKAESDLFSISEGSLSRNFSTMQSLVSEAVKQIEAARNHEGTFRGLPSGFTELDRFTAGWQRSDFVVIAARPGMGKTAFVLSMARNIAVTFKKPVAFFSLEMSAVQLVTRLISAESQLPAEKLKKGNLESYEWEQLNAKIGPLIEAPLLIDDSPSLNIFDLRAKCRRLKQHYDIQMVIIDYIQLMRGSGEKGGNREQEISNISRSLKALAKELDIPVIALSQLNRSVETRSTSKKPVLSDLRESGAIEQDADMVIFIYRPEYYNITDDEKGSTIGMADLIIAKHRNGPTGEVRLRFIGKYASFTDVEMVDIDASAMLSPNQGFDPRTITMPSRINDMHEDNPPF
jgi:replicative DNA helicase